MTTGVHDLGLFIFAGVLLNLTPGVDFLYVLGRSTARGFGAGVWAALGIGAGCFVHITAAALGLSAIIASSAAAFTVVKWIGAAYLVYVGIGMIRQRGGADGQRAAMRAATQGGAIQDAAWSSASLARRLDVASRVGRWLNRALGAMFITLGVKLALTERP